MGEKGYEELEVYRRARALLKPVHDLALTLPDYEKFDLANQLRRACKSIPANIAEGYARRRSAKEFCLFLTTALGSANEMEVHLDIAFELGYIEQSTHQELGAAYNELGRMLNGLIRYWRTVDSSAPSAQGR